MRKEVLTPEVATKRGYTPTIHDASGEAAAHALAAQLVEQSRRTRDYVPVQNQSPEALDHARQRPLTLWSRPRPGA